MRVFNFILSKKTDARAFLFYFGQHFRIILRPRKVIYGMKYRRAASFYHLYDRHCSVIPFGTKGILNKGQIVIFSRKHVCETECCIQSFFQDSTIQLMITIFKIHMLRRNEDSHCLNSFPDIL